MSTIVAANISDGTDSAPTSVVTLGCTKASFNYDMNGSTLRRSYNMASVTDAGVGIMSVVFTNAFNSIGYDVGAYARAFDAVTNGIFSSRNTDSVLTTGSTYVMRNTANAVIDSALISANMGGDLA